MEVMTSACASAMSPLNSVTVFVFMAASLSKSSVCFLSSSSGASWPWRFLSDSAVSSTPAASWMRPWFRSSDPSANQRLIRPRLT
ncbi:hypothetical protein LILAB_21890 [Corallococcus macrosporus]|uniref:Uncharacterized protein n=1 Tax=Myxococcus fulvus (strain ATCC BAA-855 / HW-1) TaxID=483219 RepID=F8CHG0_MYXFH|nr:hypothetical protein LILAB_21890 [Corallococcus macrosporus]